MKLEWLPDEDAETNLVYVAEVNDAGSVLWGICNEDVVGEAPKVGDEGWAVCRVGNAVRVEAIQWFHPEGHFALEITDKTPSEAVMLAHTIGMALESDATYLSIDVYNSRGDLIHNAVVADLEELANLDGVSFKIRKRATEAEYFSESNQTALGILEG